MRLYIPAGRRTRVSVGPVGAMIYGFFMLMVYTFAVLAIAAMVLVFMTITMVFYAQERSRGNKSTALPDAFNQTNRLIHRYGLPLAAVGLVLALTVAGIIAAVEAPRRAAAAQATQAHLDCQTIATAYQQWVDATTNATVAQDLAATRQFYGVASFRPDDATAQQLAGRLNILSGDLAAQMTHSPADQVPSAQVLADARAMRSVADRYTTCP